MSDTTMPKPKPLVRFPFSLTCTECDAGEALASAEHAIQNEWTELLFDPKGLTNNYLGLCPECQAARTAEEAERSRKRRRNPHGTTDSDGGNAAGRKPEAPGG